MTNAETIENLMTIKNIYTWSSGADEALDIAIQILKATQSVSEKCKGCVEFIECADLLNMPLGHSCEDCISREAVDDYITKLMSGYLYDEERTRLEEFSAYIWGLPSVTPEGENFTDDEKRIFLASVAREMRVCEQIDSEKTKVKLVPILKRVKDKVLRSSLW